MRKYRLFFLILLIPCFVIVTPLFAEMREFIVIDNVTPAPLRDVADGKNSIAKIPAGTKLQIKSKKDIQHGRLVVTWYEVNYKGKTGWISQYVTMGDIIQEDDSGKKSTIREKGADEVRLGTFNKQYKENFKNWALKNTTVTYLEYPQNSDWQIWVKLTPDKYTTKDNVESIALFLCKQYKMQTGFKEMVVVTIWHPYKNEVFAKGSL